MAAPAKIDWNQARKDYLSDARLSLQDIANKYGVSKKSVENKSSVEGWVALRQSLGEKALEDFQKKLIDEKSQAESRHLIQYRNLQAIINKSLMAIDQGNFWTDKKGNLVLDKAGKPIPVPPDARQLESLAKAAKISMDGERVALGLPTSVNGITGGNGESIWTGFSDMVKTAKKVIDESSKGTGSANNTGGNTS